MQIKIKKLTDTAITPSRGSSFAAGYDLYADITETLTLAPGESKLVPTGIAVAIPEGYFGGIYARSGLAKKKGLRPANCVGVVDADYRGPVGVIVANDSGSEQQIEPGERIAQLVVQPFLSVEFDEVDELPDTERGEGGFGSTGTR